MSDKISPDIHPVDSFTASATTRKGIDRRTLLKLAGLGLTSLFLSRMGLGNPQNITAAENKTNTLTGSEAVPPYGGLSVVQPGDDVNTVASRYGTTSEDLLKANPWLSAKSNSLNKGDILAIPAAVNLGDKPDVDFAYPDSLVLVRRQSDTGWVTFDQGKLAGFDQQQGRVEVLDSSDQSLNLSSQDVQFVSSIFANPIVANKAKEGATAILGKEGQAVRIVSQGKDEAKRALPGKASIEIVGGPENGAQKTVDAADLRLPRTFPDLWISSDRSDLPEGSVIRENILAAQKMVDYMNQWYDRLGIKDIKVPAIELSRFNIVPIGENPQNQNTGKQIDLFLGWIADTVNTTSGTSLELEKGKSIINHAYLDSVHKNRLRQLIGHEHGAHSTHMMFPFANEYYEVDADMTRSLELFADFIGFRSQDAYEDNHDAIADIRSKQGTEWAEMIVRQLGDKGLNGEFLLMDRGGRGDMLGLEAIYDKEYGQGAFRQLRKQFSSEAKLDTTDEEGPTPPLNSFANNLARANAFISRTAPSQG